MWGVLYVCVVILLELGRLDSKVMLKNIKTYKRIGHLFSPYSNLGVTMGTVAAAPIHGQNSVGNWVENQEN